MENFLILDSVTSTNDYAKTLARQGAAHGTAVLAKSQSAGRGRMGRTFLSPEGGLYLSVILRPWAEAAQLMALTPVLAEAACNAVEQVTGLRPKIKWCNDLLLENKKLAGILTEPSLKPDGTADFVVCGIGLNCRTVPEEVEDMAAGLGEAVNIPALAEKIRDAWLLAAETLDDPCHMAGYRKDCVTLGKQVRVMEAEPWEGIAADVDDSGALIVERDGKRQRIFTGEVSVRGLYGYV